MINTIVKFSNSIINKVLFGGKTPNENSWKITPPKAWVYYIPELETICIVYPDYVDFETRLPAVEWSEEPPAGFLLNSKPSSVNRNCIYLGEL